MVTDAVTKAVALLELPVKVSFCGLCMKTGEVVRFERELLGLPAVNMQ